jgi:hypothetical protein
MVWGVWGVDYLGYFGGNGNAKSHCCGSKQGIVDGLWMMTSVCARRKSCGI